METAIFIATILIAMFALGAILGAPFVPSRRHTIEVAFKLLKLKRGQTLLDLGSGSGGVLVAAAQRGIHAIGYEINPLLYLISKVRTARYRSLVDVRLADYWHHPLPEADAIYVFLIARYMGRLDEKLKVDIKKPTPVVSFAFKIPGKKVIKSREGLWLYRYYWNEETPEDVLGEEVSAPV